MHLTPILSQLLIGVWLYECGTVYALPAPGGPSQSSPTEQQKKVEWWQQLNQPWIKINKQKILAGSEDCESCVGYDQGSDTFKTDLTGKYTLSRMRGQLHGLPGNNHVEMFQEVVKVGNKYVPAILKVVNLNYIKASSEEIGITKLNELQEEERKLVKERLKDGPQKPGPEREYPWGVQEHNLFIDSGFFNSFGTKKGLIVMAKMPGKYLTELEEWKQGDVGQKAKMMNDAFWDLLFLVYDLARRSNIIYVDFDETNAICQYLHAIGRTQCVLIDPGAPSLFWINPEHFPRDVQSFLTVWFRPRFMYLYKGPISQAQFVAPETVPEEWR
ncbi:hypothetical protein EV361DRAFT_954492 [Lentinula raphanica]|nr:hypothetical protein EV361DRAFT_954492 [Lentinula raphanica]